MNPGRFYIPNNIGISPNIMGNMMSTTPMMRVANTLPRNMGIFSKITNSIRSVNWGGLLNNANKTLNVVNQTIPLVRQAGPMFNNIKSMLRIARAFGNETNNRNNNNNVNISHKQIIDNHENNNYSNIESINSDLQKKEVRNDNTPNFFV